MDYEDIFAEPVSYKTKGLGMFIHKGITKVLGGAFNYTQVSGMEYILYLPSYHFNLCQVSTVERFL